MHSRCSCFFSTTSCPRTTFRVTSVTSQDPCSLFVSITQTLAREPLNLRCALSCGVSCRLVLCDVVLCCVALCCAAFCVAHWPFICTLHAWACRFAGVLVSLSLLFTIFTASKLRELTFHFCCDHQNPLQMIEPQDPAAADTLSAAAAAAAASAAPAPSTRPGLCLSFSGGGVRSASFSTGVLASIPIEMVDKVR